MLEQQERDRERRQIRDRRRLQRQAEIRNRARRNARSRFVTPAGTISEAKLQKKAISAMDANSTPIQHE
ncbi:hypothetical protein BGZ93_004568, partial [Podila epicladia]